MPPTLLLLNADKPRWTVTDKLLMQTLTVWEASLCGCGCAGYRDECLDPDMQDRWLAQAGTNWRRAAIEQYQTDHAEELKEPGTFVYLADDDD